MMLETGLAGQRSGSASTVNAACTITRLRLYRFRNYAETTVRFGPRLNVISGRNAQGKTNLLEAVATLALTRSPRAASSADLVQWHSDSSLAEASVSRPTHDFVITLRLERDGESEHVARTVTIDGKPRAARAVLGLCPVVVFWPEDLQLVKAGPEGRRRLLDTLLSQLDSQASAQLVRYRHVLEQRNALLHQLRGGGDGRHALTGFTRQLAHLGARVAVARARLLTSLNPLAAAALHDLSEQRERLELRYIATYADGSAVDLNDVDAVEAALLNAFNARGAEEVARGVTVLGPHRDDLEILVDGRPARHTASQGQQRSVVLACKLAEVRHLHSITGMAPVIMLDDVLSELDPPRRAALLEVLAGEAPHQVLVTATDALPAAVSAFTDVRHFTVSEGSLTETLPE